MTITSQPYPLYLAQVVDNEVQAGRIIGWVVGDLSGSNPDSSSVAQPLVLFGDDDGFVWRAAAPTSEGLLTAWVPAKPTAGPVAALRSLRPVELARLLGVSRRDHFGVSARMRR